MNNARRAEIKALIARLETDLAKAEEIRDAEQYYFDNMPENLQGSDKGQAAEETIGTLDESVDSIQAAIDSLFEVN